MAGTICNSGIPVHSSSLFDYRHGVFTVFRSDLGDRVEDRIWADSCDVGFFIKSAKTGVQVLFTFAKQINECDTRVDIYVGAVNRRDNYPLTVRMYND